MITPALTGVIASSMLDKDARNFIIAAGITNSTQIRAINTLTKSLKLIGVWSKLSAIYPFVGGTSTSCSYNLINTTTFQITWVGAPTFASTGVSNWATTRYGNTGYNPSTNGSLNSACMGVYSRTNNTTNNIDMGSFDGSGNRYEIRPRIAAGTMLAAINTTAAPTSAVANSLGLFTVSRTASNAMSFYQNTTTVAALTTASTAAPNFSVFIGCQNVSGTPTFPTNREFAFAFIGSGLTATEVSNLYASVQAFQTTLGRQV